MKQPLHSKTSIDNMHQRDVECHSNFQSNKADQLEGLHELKQAYAIQAQNTVLGKGAFGKVFLSHSVSNPELQVAIKTIDKNALDDDQLQLLRSEIAILNRLDHPNIVNFYETYNDFRYLYIIMQYIEGEDMKKYFSQKKECSEDDICQIFRYLVKAVVHCHANGIMHRDIKPDNVLIDKTGKPFLCDFGLSHTSRKAKGFIGTPFYMAPEIFDEQKYDSKVDVWSMGIILFELLAGYHPYNPKGNSNIQYNEYVENLKNKPPNFESLKVSAECKDLLKSMLCQNPKKRLTSEQTLKHAWFTSKIPKAT